MSQLFSCGLCSFVVVVVLIFVSFCLGFVLLLFATCMSTCYGVTVNM